MSKSFAEWGKNKEGIDYALCSENRKLKLEGLKRCRICRVVKEEKEFTSRGNQRPESRCRICSNEYKKQWALSKRQDLNWFCAKTCRNLKKRAKKLNTPFDLTPEYLVELFESQGRFCLFSGIKLDFESQDPRKFVAHPSSPSIDKLDPKLGYVKENVAWCTTKVNLVKTNLTYEEFLRLCYNVVQIHF